MQATDVPRRHLVATRSDAAKPTSDSLAAALSTAKLPTGICSLMVAFTERHGRKEFNTITSKAFVAAPDMI